jgi:ribosomal-protein-alanine N-acetyltransferase
MSGMSENAKTSAPAPEPAPASARPLSLSLTVWGPEQLDQVLAIEQQVYSHPWTAGQFRDALAAGYHPLALWQGDRVCAYLVAMLGVDEVHLLNIAVAPAHQGQGLATRLLDALCAWSRAQGAQWLWLEVRESNLQALQVYEHHGFRRVGLRKDYYPAGRTQREAAVVMSLSLMARPPESPSAPPP